MNWLYTITQPVYIIYQQPSLRVFDPSLRKKIRLSPWIPCFGFGIWCLEFPLSVISFKMDRGIGVCNIPLEGSDYFTHICLITVPVILLLTNYSQSRKYQWERYWDPSELMPYWIRDGEKSEAGKIGSWEAGKKRKPFGLVLNAWGDTEGTWEVRKMKIEEG